MRPKGIEMKSVFFKYLKNEFDLGLSASQDPENAYLPDYSVRKTTRDSHWFSLICSECKMDFRIGDRVMVCPVCKTAYHQDDQFHLYCWENHFSNGQPCQYNKLEKIEICSFRVSDTLLHSHPLDQNRNSHYIPEIHSQFMKGLAVHWRSFDNLLEFKIEPDHPSIGEICQWCGSSIRAGDRVVECPCGKCKSYIHNDMVRQLTCWNDWNKSKKRNYCIKTGQEFKTNGHQ